MARGRRRPAFDRGALAAAGTNVAFSYRYRDASNGKSGGEIVFAGPLGERDVAFLRARLDEDHFFIPTQLGLEHLGLESNGFPDDDLDHVWHEFDGVTTTTAPADGPCSWRQFLARWDAIERWDDACWEPLEITDVPPERPCARTPQSRGMRADAESILAGPRYATF